MKILIRTFDGWYGLLIYSSHDIGRSKFQHSFYLKRRNHIRKKCKKFRGKTRRMY